MPAPQNVIAVVFDFDDTLTDDSTTKLLDTYGIDATDFWQNRANALVKDGWNPTLAYLKLLLDCVGHGKEFGCLSNQKLGDLGSRLVFYQGLPELFPDLRAMTEEHLISHPSIEFYVISGGLEEVIRGSFLAREFAGIWGCRFAEEEGMIRYITNAISFTEKTRYLFEINKGINLAPPQPYGVNKEFAPAQRRVPFENMIYIGDGLTDVPCFSLVGRSGGKAFGVFDPKKAGSPKKAWEGLIVTKRVNTMNSPRYGANDDLGSLLRAAIKEICLRMDVRTQTA